MKKTFGFYASVLAALLGVVSLVILLIYKRQGGIVTTGVIIAAVAAIVLEAASFFGEKVWTDFTSVAGAACLAYVMIKVLGDGIWNIAEAMNGIKMVGLPELAGMNYALAGVGAVAVVVAIVACFFSKSKKA